QAILATRVPGADANLSRQVVAFVQELRKIDLFKLPGVAESIDWLSALGILGVSSLEADIVRQTLGVLLKYQDDIEKIEGDELRRLLDAAA
ncbi:MAG: MoxR family ATPase, partial [Rhodospirillaceae bacterium]|nr:MoxR family ATPase [Rhodospirillaceae bacterium]